MAASLETANSFKHTVAVANGFYFENMTLLGHSVKGPVCGVSRYLQGNERSQILGGAVLFRGRRIFGMFTYR